MFTLRADGMQTLTSFNENFINLGPAPKRCLKIRSTKVNRSVVSSVRRSCDKRILVPSGPLLTKAVYDRAYPFILCAKDRPCHRRVASCGGHDCQNACDFGLPRDLPYASTLTRGGSACGRNCLCRARLILLKRISSTCLLAKT